MTALNQSASQDTSGKASIIFRGTKGHRAISAFAHVADHVMQVSFERFGPGQSMRASVLGLSLFVVLAAPTTAETPTTPDVRFCITAPTADVSVAVPFGSRLFEVPARNIDPFTAAALAAGEAVEQPAFVVDVRLADQRVIGPAECDTDAKSATIRFRLVGDDMDPGPTGPFAIIKRARDRIARTGQDALQGMTWADHNLDGPISGLRDYFVFDDAPVATAQLTCSAWSGPEAPPVPLCDGLIAFNDAGLAVQVQMPSYLGFQGTTAVWREVAAGIETMIADWRD